MTEQKLKQEWLEANNWEKRYDFIEKYLTTDRLKQLFAFNCAKLPEIYKALTDPRSINALEILDKYLDGKTTKQELEKARNEAWKAYYTASAASAAYASASAAYASASAAYAAYAASADAASADASDAASNQPEYQAEILVKLLRPEWEFNLNWLTETTKSLAAKINDEKRYDLSPILADALEDNHCNNQNLLNYLRNTNNLPKGDWIIEHITNKR